MLQWVVLDIAHCDEALMKYDHVRLGVTVGGFGHRTEVAMIKTFKYRLYPNKTQEQRMNRHLHICCRLYNALLEYCQLVYERDDETLSGYDKNTLVDEWGREHSVLGELSATMRRDVARRVHQARQHLFDKSGVPSYKSRRYYSSFGVTQWQCCKITREGRQGKVRIYGVGEITCRFHRPLEGKPKTWTIKKHPSGKWFITIAAEVEAETEPETGNSIGVDMGLTHFLITSDGEFYEPLHKLRDSEQKIRRLNKSLDRKNKGSNRYKEVRKQLARAHEKVRNQRHYIHHTVARELVEEYDFIAVEDLNIENMMRNRYLAKSIADAAWGTFLTILKQKAEETGKQVVKVNPHNTSQICSECGVKVEKDLDVRQHTCPDCGLDIHRDINAARNILTRGYIKIAQDIEAVSN